MNYHLRRDVTIEQKLHPDFGELYSLIYECQSVLLDTAFSDWRDRFNLGEIPLLSLEAMPPSHDAGQWRGKFMEIGPLGFTNVISFNLCKFESSEEIPVVLAHEMTHWWDRPNTGHSSTFWAIMMERYGMTRHHHFGMTWVRMCELMPLEQLSEISLWPRDSQDVVD